jgi:hypothetical protein
MSLVLDGTAGITTPEITSAGGPLVVNESAPDNSVVVNASGNMGIGTSSPGSKLHVKAATNQNLYVTGAGSLANAVTLAAVNDAVSANVPLEVRFGSALGFYQDNTERARIDSSGSLLVGTTSQPNGTSVYGSAFVGETNSRMVLRLATSSTTQLAVARFYNPNGQVGEIKTQSSSTLYVTSSDYRLKHDIQPMTGALAKVAALKPCTYTWKVDGSGGQGFIAHELAEVEPGCVTGEKDAVDAEGSPVYQGIDTSFLVATLTAAIQEQQAIINAQQAALESLTARVVALEGQAT